MKYCKVCNKIYKETDCYCLKCNRRLVEIDVEQTKEIAKKNQVNVRPLHKSPAFWTWIIFTLISLLVFIKIIIIDICLTYGFNGDDVFLGVLSVLIIPIFPTYIAWRLTLSKEELDTMDKTNEAKRKADEAEQEAKRQAQRGAECPYCHSKDTYKLSGLSKGASIATFGLFSNKIGKQWHCNNCKSNF